MKDHDKNCKSQTTLNIERDLCAKKTSVLTHINEQTHIITIIITNVVPVVETIMSTIREGADRPEDRSRRDTILKLLALLPATYAGSLAVVGRAEAQASPPGQDSDFTPPGQGGDGPPGCGPSGGRPSKCDSSSSDSSHSDDSSSDSSHSDDSSSENGTTPSEESGSDEDSPRSASVRAECRAIEREYAGQPISAIQPPSRQQFYLENCYCENIRSRFGGQPLSSLSPADQSWFRQYCLPSR